MRIPVFLCASFMLANAANAQSSPSATVDALFEAMRSGDGEAVRELMAKDAKLTRVESDGTITVSDFEDWALWVNTQNPGDADERIFNVEVREFGDLASVWAPFVLKYKNEISGCGVNQFTLGRSEGTWRIIRGTDTQDSGDCETFSERYKGNQ